MQKTLVVSACLCLVAAGVLAVDFRFDVLNPLSRNNSPGSPGNPNPPGRDRCSPHMTGEILPSTNCSNFVVCERNREIETTCLPLGTMFDYERGVCDHPDNVRCWMQDRCTGLANGTLLPSTRCANFIICMGGQPHEEVECVPWGTLFDPQRQVCDHAENVQCWNPDSNDNTTTTTISPPVTEQAPTRPPLDAEVPADTCRFITIGMQPHPTDCTRFIVCVLGQPNVQHCPPDYIFYPEVGVCGYGNPHTCGRSKQWLDAYMRAVSFTL